jgi:hypothetical protein
MLNAAMLDGNPNVLNLHTASLHLQSVLFYRGMGHLAVTCNTTYHALLSDIHTNPKAVTAEANCHRTLNRAAESLIVPDCKVH